MKQNSLDDQMILSHLGDDYDKYLGAVIPPVFMTSLHVFKTAEDYFAFDATNEGEFLYGRTGNPTAQIVEKKVAALERGGKALLFSSGMAAITAVISHVCQAGSHVICSKNAYGPVKAYLDNYCIPKLKMSVTYVGTELAEFEASIRPETALIMLESPSTFVFSITNLRAVASLAQKHGIKTYIDNTFCTPLFQKPIELGIDFVMHTASKYLGGHSDLIGGVLVGKDAAEIDTISQSIREWHGGVIGPMEAWLIIRGMRTLDVRLHRHQATAMTVASYLEQHPKVRQVYYPGLPSHPQYELMSSQQSGNTGLLSFELDASLEESVRFLNQLQLFKIGCSWGGFESLALMPLYSMSPEGLQLVGADRNLIRIHCGLEGEANLLSDLDQAFTSI